MKGVLPLARLEHPSLVPASLLPPEDPAGRVRRTLRDWLVDVVLFAIAVVLGLVALDAVRRDALETVPDGKVGLDLLLGAVGCLALWVRRRSPVGVAVATVALGAFSCIAAVASLLALFTVAVHRRTQYAVLIAVLSLASTPVYAWWIPTTDSLLQTFLLGVVALAVVIGWGMVVRARRQLVWSLRERAERAEAEQRLLADQARTAERSRIAREMHDVLAHRISLLALHAGGLEMRRDLPADQVRETASLLRTTARQALEELRDVIGVLREHDDAAAPSRPQPTLRELGRLIDERRRAGAKIDCDIADLLVPDALGRDAYRIVQEALTNVAKHAHGTATAVQIAGAPSEGLSVRVANRLPVRSAAGPSAAELPGSGSGLIGLAERVELAGGTLEHGRRGDEFVVEARLPWR